VRAVLSKVVPQRPDGKGGLAACDTWDNATLLCEAVDRRDGAVFPLLLKTQRIAPGEKNTWTIEIKGMQGCARFSTKNPRRLEVLQYSGGEQIWQQIDTGNETLFKSITGPIFEFGFSDLLLQMWAAFLNEMTGGKLGSRFAACVTPEEAALSHRLFTAALASAKNGTTETL
jgi:predicted dehydrogenase